MIILLWAIPIFNLTMLFEWLLTRKHAVKGYEIKDSAASLSMGIGNLVTMFGFKMITFAIFMWLYEYRLFDLPVNVWWVWLLLIPVDDFFYYWFHRCSHDIRFFWAAHINHHSSLHYNLSTALRQSWTGPAIGWVFWIPLPLLGFHPLMIAMAQAISLLYQYWIHTELIGKLGPLEWVMNTPSHHRVHHSSDHEYLDRNHAGIFIVWDKLFGTFEEEKKAITYGLTKNVDSFNPVVIAFHEWRDLFRDVRQAKTWRGRIGYFIAPPGWREDGTGVTSSDLRAAAKFKTEP